MDNAIQFINKVEKLRRTFDFNYPKDSVEDLLNLIEGTVSYEDFQSDYKYWSAEKINGALVIKINKALSEERQKFFLMCGMASAMLKGYLTYLWSDVEENKDFNMFGQVEKIQAFAGQFLMPKDQLRYYIDDFVSPNGEVDIKGLADIYKLEPTTVEWWAKFNGFIYSPLFGRRL